MNASFTDTIADIDRGIVELRKAQPDAMAGFSALARGAAEGPDVSSLEHGDRGLRDRKAIPIDDAPCASCHGVSIAPGLLREIQARYPTDEAVGCAADDVRGAFTLVKTLR